jgi:hypothetical protein
VSRVRVFTLQYKRVRGHMTIEAGVLSVFTIVIV